MIKKIKQLTGFLALLLVAPLSLATTVIPVTLQTNDTSPQINALISRVNNPPVGIIIKNLTTGQIIYQHNENQPYIPASNLKVFTAVAGLEYLTPNFAYQTYISSATNTVTAGILEADLYMVFSGDPSLTRNDVMDLFQQLKLRGITQIKGNIYIDDTLFDNDGRVPAALPENNSYCFSAPVVAATIDHNCIGITVKPGSLAGAPSLAGFIQPPNAALLVNRVTTSNAKNCGINPVLEANNGYILSGCINTNVSSLSFGVAAPNMRLYAGGLLPLALEKAGIEFHGRIMFDKAPPQTFALAIHQSEPLSTLIKHMLKKSDNLYANALAKTLGARYYQGIGTWNTAGAAMTAILKESNNINLSRAKLVDGAGLSRLNQITANEMLQVLSTAYHNPAINQAFIQALPIGGIDGTLKGRFTETAYRNRVYAKTGTLSDVSSLSGFVNNSKNETLAFAILVNGVPAHTADYRWLEDRICKILMNSK